MARIIVIAHNIRSTHNVGSIFRTCEGFGVEKLILSGYTPYPDLSARAEAPSCAYIDGEITHDDPRIPHIREKLTAQIHKTALGAEQLVPFEYHETLDLGTLDLAEFRKVALEQGPNSVNLQDYIAPENIALIIGEEVHGITSDILAECETILEIPMHGHKESFNVSVATGIALYALSLQ
ncbi:MAG: TrmH family RNA methyltransferase [Candidatus Saccharimonas sp.]